MKRTCLCVVIDILGFKDLVARKSLDDIHSQYLGLLQGALYRSIQQDSQFLETITMADINNQSVCDVVWFSDSIFLFSKNDTDDCIYRIISTISWLLFESNLGLATKLRCGISHGEVFLDLSNQIFFGQPIIDAHHLEGLQEWSGGALTTSACSRIDSLEGKFLRAVNDLYLVDYDIPVKENSTLRTRAVNWTTGIHNYRVKFLWDGNSEHPSEEDWVQHYGVCKKFVNTRKFHSDVCVECKKVPMEIFHESDATVNAFMMKLDRWINGPSATS